MNIPEIKENQIHIYALKNMLNLNYVNTCLNKQANDKFKFLILLENNNFKSVFKVLNKWTNNYVVCKIILNKKLEQQAIMESNFLNMCKDHPHIINLHETYKDECFYYIITEYACYCDLFEYTKKTKLLFSQKINIICQVLSALEYCHANLIYHGDIKPENIVVCNRDLLKVKLIDFGFADKITFNPFFKKIKCGTYGYVCPEILNGEFINLFKADIWSFGVVLYRLIFNLMPFTNLPYEPEKIKYEGLVENNDSNDIVNILKSIFVGKEERICFGRIKKYNVIKKTYISSHLKEIEVINTNKLHVINYMTNIGFDVDCINDALKHKKSSCELYIYKHLENILDKE